MVMLQIKITLTEKKLKCISELNSLRLQCDNLRSKLNNMLTHLGLHTYAYTFRANSYLHIVTADGIQLNIGSKVPRGIFNQ